MVLLFCRIYSVPSGRKQHNGESAKSKRRIQKCAIKNNQEAHSNTELDPSVTEEAKEVQQGAHRAKAVARWGPPVCGRTWLRAQPWWRQTGPTFLWRLHAAMHRTVSPPTKIRS